MNKMFQILIPPECNRQLLCTSSKPSPEHKKNHFTTLCNCSPQPTQIYPTKLHLLTIAWDHQVFQLKVLVFRLKFHLLTGADMALSKPSLFLRHPKGFVSAVRLACFGLPIVTLTTNKGLKAERVLNCLQKKNFLRSSLTFGNFCDICSPAHSLSLLTLSCLFSLLSQTQTLLASRR